MRFELEKVKAVATYVREPNNQAICYKFLELMTIMKLVFYVFLHSM